MSITPAECKAARKLLGWSQPKLAEMLLVDESAISAFERRERFPRALNRHELRGIFEAAGVEFAEGAEPKLKANASNDE
jgi:transcriptional regulator with XRE-family HTH domain